MCERGNSFHGETQGRSSPAFYVGTPPPPFLNRVSSCCQMSTPPPASAPHTQLCTVKSLHPFKTHYVRNNRRSTEKNLRCFPCCNAGGHVTQGFCGRGCLFRITTPISLQLPDGTRLDPRKMSCLVELSLCKEQPEGMPVAGTAYPADEINSRKKTGEPEPWTRPYWEGTANNMEGTENAEAVVDFSFSPTHWHYGWRSNKHTNTYRHTCRIYVFHEIQGGAQLLCLGSTQEGAFTISSTKKRQPEVPPGTAADKQARSKNKPKKKRRKTGKQKKIRRQRAHSTHVALRRSIWRAWSRCGLVGRNEQR